MSLIPFLLEVAVCLKELLDELNRRGVVATESQIRWAIRTGKVERPRVDGSLRFDFSQSNITELVGHFAPEAAHA